MTDYPTDEELEKIRQWPMEAANDLPPYVASVWCYPESAQETSAGLWVFATGGWSGNEEILAAMRDSMAWYLLHWQHLYVAGGLIIVATNEEAKKKVETLRHYITQWAWNGGTEKK